MRPTKSLPQDTQMLAQRAAPRPIAPPPTVAPTPRLPGQLTYLAEKLSTAHSVVGGIEDSVNRLQSPVPTSSEPAACRDGGTTVEDRLDTALFVVDGLLDRLSSIASRLNALV